MKKSYWLLKSEPSTWSWKDQEKAIKTNWDGVRNYQARNNLIKMKKGDLCFFYHSVNEKRIVGIVEVVKEHYPDLQNLVQPSKIRCFNNKKYEQNGALIQEDISKSDLILGVKEIEPNLLIQSKSYMFFSHTSKIQADNSAAAQGTPGMDKKELLKEILMKKNYIN